MATQGVFTLPPNTRFGVTAFANSSATQTVKVLVNNETAATFTGQSTNNAVIGSQVFNSGGGGKVQIQVSVNGRSSDLVSAQVILANELNFALVGSEDSTDNDYNDAVVVINWPLG
ncbi:MULTISPECIES: fucose-binding lectin LecB [Pseudomonas aeruginosa group]|uniref:fucose-binding lectin LecB n=1 Tax=Pseudomonas aeruginosa group TaxID=136841 RepID=UPI0005BD7D07|nr:MULTISPECIES: fucose-binding lectin LecB [Pseudomonas aeruginosa group]MDK2353064.1 fucose-binding lectin LecB [Pseudomonas paraeruginosa]MEA8485057.1 fucose-binding lectin II [Pseudomonas aeruginosa]